MELFATINSISMPPENIRKTKIFWRFLVVYKRNILLQKAILDIWLGSKNNSSIKHKTFKYELCELINLL